MKTLSAQRILRISRVVADLDRAEAFYRDALGFEVVSLGVSHTAKLGLGEADEVVLRLGSAIIVLVRFAVPGQPYPADSRSNDLWFQHLAIVVSDMDAAYAHLLQAGQWRAITQGGPQLLPPENGNVRAFKFRDPAGHPLELIWFPDRGQGLPLFQGVDHSALSISSTHRGLVFYRSLGFHVSNRSLNHGPAQDRLDGRVRFYVVWSKLRIRQSRESAPWRRRNSATKRFLPSCNRIRIFATGWRRSWAR